MDKNEIYKQAKLSYKDLVSYLLDKYGKAEHDYFTDKSCEKKNPLVTRSKEGLFCHHIDEDKAIMLSHGIFAKENPFKYQKAERLVYCNIIEHLLLHVKIAEEPRNKKANSFELPGIGGAVNFLCKQINDFYDGKEIEAQWLVKVYDNIKENYNEYIEILKMLKKVVENHPVYSVEIDLADICCGMDGKVIEKIANDVGICIDDEKDWE